MDINAITPTQLPLNTATATPDPAGITPLSSKSEPNKDSISLGASVPSKTGKLGFLNDRSNSLAMLVKETDQKLSILADSIDKMKGALDAIVKNFPPFSPDSMARKDLLMTYASIRKELLQMTIPAPPPPIYEKIQHQWQDLFQNDAPSKTIKLPGEVESSTPDSALTPITADLGTLHDSITSVRSDLKQSLLNTK